MREGLNWQGVSEALAVARELRAAFGSLGVPKDGVLQAGGVCTCGYGGSESGEARLTHVRRGDGWDGLCWHCQVGIAEEALAWLLRTSWMSERIVGHSSSGLAVALAKGRPAQLQRGCAVDEWDDRPVRARAWQKCGPKAARTSAGGWSR